MERYTEKINEFDYKLTKYNDIVRANARQKLGELEDLEEQLGCPIEKLIEFSRQETVYTIYGTHTNEIVIVDLNLCRIHISINGDINNSYCLYFKDYKKTWWLKWDKSE